ncbi:MAG: PQQ-binding-like beta-propeller repeat protein [Planctomycetia bacterium]|nr:PQQ-binding-like beta-propeller repeat protein [Planctomycetia bacterium]
MAAPPPAGAGAAQEPLQVTADSWPLFRGDAQARGVAVSPLPEKPEVLWKKTFKDAAFEATAVIQDGIIYIGTNNSDASGDLLALSLADGAEKWKFHSDAGFSSAAGLRGGRIYVGNFEGRCYCLDAAGKPLWGFEAKATIHGGPNFYRDQVLFTSEDGALYCLNGADGKLVWEYKIDQPLYCAPTIVENRVFLGGCDSAFHVIDLDTGKAVAVVDIGVQTGNAPAVIGDRAYFGTLGAGVLGIDWRKPEIAWTYVAGRRKQEYKSSAALSEGLVVLGCNDRQLRGIRMDDGKEAWTFAAKGNIESSPVVVGSRAFVGSSDGRLYAVDVKTGELVWDYEAGSDIVASPAVAAGRLVIGDIDGHLYCFGAK